MIIDVRLRPPVGGFLQSTLNLGTATNYHLASYNDQFGMGALDESVRQGSLELCVKEMDECGIDIACCPARWGIGENAEPAVTPEEIIDVMEAYPGRFYGALALSARQPRKSLEIIDKYICGGKIQAASMDPGMELVHVNDKSLYPVYELLSEKNIPLFMMLGGGNPLIEYGKPEYVDRMLSDFPKLTLLGAHGCVPYVDEDIFLAFRHPNYFISPDVYIMNTPYRTPYVEAANQILQDQFIFGTTYPFISMKSGLEYYKQLPFREDVRDKIFYKNAARALNIQL